MAMSLEGRSQEFHEFGPLFQNFGLTLDSGKRTEILGPLYYDEAKGPTKTWASPPVFSYVLDQDVDSEEFDFVYPLLSYDRFGEEYRWHFFQIISLAGGQTQSGTNTSRLTLFPFYFQQRSADPARNYTAVFPFYGHLDNRLFRREIDFVLWPLYVKTTRRAQGAAVGSDEFVTPGARWVRARRGEMTTYNFVVPIFHMRVGEGLSGWQFWPLAGRETQLGLSKTNEWGDIVSSGGYTNLFVLWPLIFDQRRGLEPDNPERFQTFLPFYSSLRSPKRDSFTAPWPIGFTRTDDRGRKYKEWGAPWPLVVFARGEGKTTDRVLPFFSRSHSATMQRDWYLWPFYRYHRLHADPLDYERTSLLFFLYSDRTEKNTETGQFKHRTDFWPLFTSQRDLAGNRRFQALAVLEPFLPASKSIERNYSPLWSVWRSEKNGQTGAASQSLLWNLYRHESRPQSKKCSLLFGLFQYHSGPEGHRLRLFYIPVGGKGKRPEPAVR